MRCSLVWGFLAVGLLCQAAAAPSADYTYVPPTAAESLLKATLNPLPVETVEAYLTHVDRFYTFDTFAGQNEALKAAAGKGEPLPASKGFAVDLPAQDLFDDGFQDGAYRVYVVGLCSVDAEALRVLVDLSQLAVDDEVWLVDPMEPRAFGPYTADDHLPSGRWLATTAGDSAVLAVRTLADAMPQVDVLALSHFYIVSDTRKLLSCNIDIACETDTVIQEVSTGIGVMIIPVNSLDFAFCSGCLIDNPDTTNLEPYFLTANHCVPTVPDAQGLEVEQVDILWDFRTTACDADDAPSLSSLLRSNVDSLLVTSGTLDASLLALDDVPVGSLGRAYLGWDTSTPGVGESVITLHHPQQSYMRISYGRVLAVDQDSVENGYYHQTRVVWDEGVTEQGSSGACLLTDDGRYRIIGVLSNGAIHTCGADRSGNIDMYSSFRHFYSKADEYLSGEGSGDTSDTTSLCPAVKVFADTPEIVAWLRSLRDAGLLKIAGGRRLVDAYYRAAPYLAKRIDQSPEARNLFVVVAAPFASIGRALE